MTAEQRQTQQLTTIGSHVARLRSLRGLSQEQLGNVIGRSKNSVSRWEIGRQEMGILDAIAVATALETSVESIVRGSTDEEAPTVILPAIRREPLFFLSSKRLASLRKAKHSTDIAKLFPSVPPVGSCVEPEDSQVSEAAFHMAVAEAAAIFRAKASGPLKQVIRQLRQV